MAKGLGVGGCYLIDAITFAAAFYGAVGLPSMRRCGADESLAAWSTSTHGPPDRIKPAAGGYRSCKSSGTAQAKWSCVGGFAVQILSQGRDLGIVRGLPDGGVLKMYAFK